MKMMNSETQEWVRKAWHAFVEVLLWFGIMGDGETSESEDKEFRKRMNTLAEVMEDENEEIQVAYKVMTSAAMAAAQEAWAETRTRLDNVKDFVTVVKDIIRALEE